MRPQSSLPHCQHEAAMLLPWYVNGTLSADQVRRAEAHFAQCEACRAELDEQRQVNRLMRMAPAVECAPQAGWRTLRSRIEAAGQVDAARPAAKRIAWRIKIRPVAWLSAALVVQSVALVTLVGVGLIGNSMFDAAPRYRTLTSAPAVGGLRLRVVFESAMTLGELNELLRANQLVCIAGPSEAGLFTLAMQSPNADSDARRAVLARLRADPRVLFVDLLGGEADSR